MQKLALILMFCVAAVSLQAQTEEDKIKLVIDGLFDGMRKGDTVLVKNAFAKDVSMQTVAVTAGGTEIRSADPAGFISFVGKPHTEIYDERITYDHIVIDGSLAHVWTPYKFYIGDKFSHCGVNSFTLVKSGADWKITHIIDTRRKERCD